MKVFDQVFEKQTISNIVFKTYYSKIKNGYKYRVNIRTYSYLYLLQNSNIFKYFCDKYQICPSLVHMLNMLIAHNWHFDSTLCLIIEQCHILVNSECKLKPKTFSKILVICGGYFLRLQNKLWNLNWILSRINGYLILEIFFMLWIPDAFSILPLELITVGV